MTSETMPAGMKPWELPACDPRKCLDCHGWGQIRARSGKYGTCATCHGSGLKDATPPADTPAPTGDAAIGAGEREAISRIANEICDNGSCRCRTGAQEQAIASRIWQWCSHRFDASTTGKVCAAAPDHADILETIENASDDWQKNGYTSALAEVRDMANVGRALMEALPAGYSYLNCPSEIVADLQNERDETLAAPPHPASEGGAGGAGVCVASRASVPERGAMWRLHRAAGVPIVSTWIDEDGEGQTEDNGELWARIHREVVGADRLVLYVEPDDFPLKGALVEVGMALAANVPVYVVAPGVECHPHTMRPLGSWAHHPGVRFCASVEEAFEYPNRWCAPIALSTPAPDASALREAVEMVRGFYEVLTLDCGVDPCEGSMAPAEQLCGQAKRFLAALRQGGQGVDR